MSYLFCALLPITIFHLYCVAKRDVGYLAGLDTFLAFVGWLIVWLISIIIYLLVR